MGDICQEMLFRYPEEEEPAAASDMKLCPRCRWVLHRAAFPATDRYVSTYCRSCKGSYDREYVRATRVERPPQDCRACGEQVSDRPRRGPQPLLCKPCRTDPQRITPCSQCGERKPRAEFRSRGSDPTVCAPCRKPYYREMRLREHRLTPEIYAAMVEAQNGVCSICKKPPCGRGNRSKLHIDHCHKTGVVRELLCSNCNLAIGLLDDDPIIAQAVSIYLSRHCQEERTNG